MWSHLTTAQQGAAPDRLQPCVSLVPRSTLALPAAGELGRYAAGRSVEA